MFDKDKPYWKAKEDRNLRLSEGMDKAIAEYRYKKENGIPIDMTMTSSGNEKPIKKKLANLPSSMRNKTRKR